MAQDLEVLGRAPGVPFESFCRANTQSESRAGVRGSDRDAVLFLSIVDGDGVRHATRKRAPTGSCVRIMNRLTVVALVPGDGVAR